LNGNVTQFETQNGFIGLKYQEEFEEDYMYYWYLFKEDRLFICSFTINSKNKNSEKNIKEIEKVNNTLSSIEL
jgi:hypothetical protein